MRVTFKAGIHAIHKHQFGGISTNSREETHHQINQRLSLNRFDAKFMNDISQRYITRGRPLSEGQSALWEKIIHKYRKQLRKVGGVDYKDILAQEWKNGVYSNDSILQDSFFRIEEDDTGPQMVLRFKFNKDMIAEVRALVHDDARNYLKKAPGLDEFGNQIKYPFIWSNDDRYWKGPFEPHLFRELNKFAVKHELTIDDSVKELVYAMRDKTDDAGEWQVKMVESNGFVYINNCPEALYNVLVENDVCLEGLSLVEMETLCNDYGIAPPDTIDPKIREIMLHRKFDTNKELDQTTYEAQQALDEYLKKTGRRALFLMHAMSEEDIRKYAEGVKPHTLATLFTAEHRRKILNGEINTIIATNALFTVLGHQQHTADVVNALDKFIKINATVYDNN